MDKQCPANPLASCSAECPESSFAGCHKVSLGEVLALREERARRQQELAAYGLAMFGHAEQGLAGRGLSLACLCLNIPGEYKDFPWARRSFREERRIFTLALKGEGIEILHDEPAETKAGYTGYMLAGASPETVKAIARRIEDTHPLGRLFDIDILTPAGTIFRKLSRGDEGAPPRPCLVCGGNGFACARSRAHPPEELCAAVLNIMAKWLREKLADTVSSAAVRSLTGEIAVTPKPGLVDRDNSGAHRDMDFFSFINSTAAILPYFRDCACAGFESAGDPIALFESLRPRGRIAEVLMREASGGANTHRGAIFSIGILSAAYGRLYRDEKKPELSKLMELCRAMTSRLGEDFSDGKVLPEASHGELVYSQNGIPGIRGEVSRGFPTVCSYSLPTLRRILAQGHSMNDAGIAALLCLLAHTDDTNIIHRSNLETLRRIQRDLGAFLEPNPGIEDLREKAAALNRDFIARNISPGGCADLLGVTLFLHGLLP
ncbi:protein CitXG [Spirochaetia bacterium]|nr:protein CitXG [Spirochaetia bacterium]